MENIYWVFVDFSIPKTNSSQALSESTYGSFSAYWNFYSKIPQKINNLALSKRKKTILISEVSSFNYLFKTFLDFASEKNYMKRSSRIRIEYLSKPKSYLSRHVHNKCLNIDNEEKIYYKPKKVAIKSPQKLISHQKWLKRNAGPKRRIYTVLFQFKNLPKMAQVQNYRNSYRNFQKINNLFENWLWEKLSQDLSVE